MRSGAPRAGRQDGGRAEGLAGVGRFRSPPPLKEFVEKRTASVAAQVAGTSKGYVPTWRFGGPPPRDRK